MGAAMLGVLALLPQSGLALAQDPVIGQMEYQAHCAACHGLEGLGDGPVGQVLKTPAPNLALIAARNGGVYSVQKVYDVIEGSTVIAAHGTRDMPLWGDRYRRSSAPVTPDQAAIANDMAQQRILSLVYYLGTLQ
jgi:mono/diheme cytochrome c family protein